MTIRTIHSGQKSYDAKVDDGDSLRVESGGAVYSATVEGVLGVGTGGVAVSATISSGGTLRERGRDYETVVSSGGVERLSSGGAAFSATVLAGGEFIDSGGLIKGGLTADGGVVEFAPGAYANVLTQSQSVTLTHSAMAVFDGRYDGPQFGIGGFAEAGTVLEVKNFSPPSAYTWSQGVDSGLLTLFERGGDVKIDLVGNFTGGNFGFSETSNHNFFIWDKRVWKGPSVMAQAAAGMGDSTPGIAVHAGGAATPVQASLLAGVVSCGR